MSGGLPAISGRKLMKLLEKDGWQPGGKRTHGVAYTKKVGGKVRVTLVPTRSSSLAPRTLGLILGPKQTNLGRKGLLRLLKKK